MARAAAAGAWSTTTIEAATVASGPTLGLHYSTHAYIVHRAGAPLDPLTPTGGTMPHLSWTRSLIAALTVTVAIGAATAGETIGVEGSSARFPAAIEIQAAGQPPVRLTLTGAAVRKMAFINVYAIASYLQDGVAAKTADQLDAADGVKVLVLVMERDVAGRDIADGIRTGVRLNHPADAFATELAQIGQVLRAMRLVKGDRVTLIATPGAGSLPSGREGGRDSRGPGVRPCRLGHLPRSPQRE